MHRFFCTSLTASLGRFVIDNEQEAHHMTRVLRLRPGDEVELVNGRGVSGHARLTSVPRRGAVEVELLSFLEGAQSLTPRVILACALPKKSRFDDILEKCTELGVDEIIPLVTARTEVAPSAEAIGRMHARFENVIISASKQCQRLWFPKVHPAMRFEAAVDLFAQQGGTLYIPWLEGERAQLSAVGFPRSAASWCFLIGPEGDFTSQEAAYAVSRGAIPVSLGETVLRVATAAIAVAAHMRFIPKG